MGFKSCAFGSIFFSTTAVYLQKALALSEVAIFADAMGV